MSKLFKMLAVAALFLSLNVKAGDESLSGVETEGIKKTQSKTLAVGGCFGLGC